MKILVDIGHPAHVHFYLRSIRSWLKSGHRVIVTSRKKEIATDLLDAIQVHHLVLSTMNDGTPFGMLKELVSRDYKLLKVVLKEKPDILTGIGGIYVAHTGFVTRTPSITFYDTENAKLSNLITYPFNSLVAVPDCYKAWLPPWNIRYPGYHELSYLHPENFRPDIEIARRCGLAADRPTFLLRVVSWQASHDLSEKGWNIALLERLTAYLQERGKVIISSETQLPPHLLKYGYQGPPELIHHLMAHLKLFIGESATMASECAVLGVPAVYAAETGRGYTDEQEERYGLVFNIRMLDWKVLKDCIDKVLKAPAENWQTKREKLLSDKIDVSKFVTQLILGYPSSMQEFKQQFNKNV